MTTSVILADSSVWIDHLRDRRTQAVVRLRSLMSGTLLIVGDLILCEVLRGVRDEAEALRVERGFREYPIVSVFNPGLAVKAATNYRYLRGRGITMSKLGDLLIGTFCIEHDHVLLHSDRDYEPMERFLGLRTNWPSMEER